MDDLSNSVSPDAIKHAINAFVLGPHDGVEIDGVDYVQQNWDSNAITLQRVDCPTIHVAYNQRDFNDLVRGGKVDYKRNFYRPKDVGIRAGDPYQTLFSSLPEDEQRELLVAKEFVERVEKLYRLKKIKINDEDLAKAIPLIHAEMLASDLFTQKGEISARKEVSIFGPPKPAALKIWRRKYLDSGRNIMSLRDGRRGRTGKRGSTIADPELLAFFNLHVQNYISERRPTIAYLYRIMNAEFEKDFAPRNSERLEQGEPALCLPCNSTFTRAIEDLDKFRVLVGRYGEDEARIALRIVGKGAGALRAAESVLIDHWKLNIWSLPIMQDVWKKLPKSLKAEIKRIRLWLCVAMCEATRVPLSFKLSTRANSDSARATLAMVGVDKTKLSAAAGCRSPWYQCASAERIRNDGGAAFVELSYRATVVDTGAEHEVGPAKNPEARAILERAFGTFEAQLMQIFTGRTFNSIMALGSYPAAERASALVEILGKVICRYLVDIYMNTAHSGLGGQTPADAWIERTRLFGVLPPPGPAMARAIFGFERKREISNLGLRHLGCHYRSQDLADYFKVNGPQTVLIRVNLLDLEYISWRVIAPGTPWYTAKNDTDGFRGVSAEQWIKVAGDLRRRYGAEAALRAPIVQAALLELKEIGEGAAELAELGVTAPTDEMIDKAERSLFKTFLIEPPSTRRRPMADVEQVESGGAADKPVEAPPALEVPVALLSTTITTSRPSRRRGAGGFLTKA